MKLSITEMYELFQGQAAYDEQKTRSFKLSLLMVSNTKALKAALAPFEETRKELLETKEYTEYTKKREEMVNEHRIKNTDGTLKTAVQDGKQVYPLEHVDKLQAKLDKLDKEYAEAIKENKENMKTVTDAMDEVFEVTLKKITDAKVISTLSPATLTALAPIIEVTLTEKVIGEELGSKLTSANMERLLKYCKVQ